MSLKSKALTAALAAAAVIMTSHGAYASSYEDQAWGNSTSGSNINMDASRTTVQDSGASVDSSVVESGEVRVGVAPGSNFIRFTVRIRRYFITNRVHHGNGSRVNTKKQQDRKNSAEDRTYGIRHIQ